MSASREQKEQIVAAYIGNGQPESFRMVCPACKGGSTREACLGVSYKATLGLAFLCHRAHCGLSGYVAMFFGDQADSLAYNAPRKVYTGESEQLGGYDIAEIVDRYKGLARPYPDLARDLAAMGWLKDKATGSWVFECRSFDGNLIGKVLRTKDKKIVTYGAGIYGVVPAWQLGVSALVIVEDYISACAVALCGYDALALMGTNLSPELARNIKARFASAYLYLDPDAFEKAIEMASKYEMSVVIPGAYDPKDNPMLAAKLAEYVR